MGWVTRELKIPDDRSWIALVRIYDDGETNIIGYIDTREFENSVDTIADIHKQIRDSYAR